MNQNVLPRPGVLSSPISPPMSSTSRLEIARPSPVPPYRREVDPSACEKDRNKRERASGSIPIPVSWTSKRTSEEPFASAISRARTST